MVCIPAPHLGLFQWCLCTFPVEHTEGDALGFRGESPADSGTRTAHGNGDGAVTTGLDEELPGAVPKPWDVIDREVDRKTAAQVEKPGHKTRLQ